MEDKTASAQLVELLTTHFNLAELHELCFVVGFNFDELPNTQGELTKNVIALIKILHRQDRLPKFIELCQKKRPHVKWPDAPTGLYFAKDIQEAIQKYKKHIRADEIGRDDLLQDFALDELYIPLKGQGAAAEEEKPKEDDLALPVDKDLSSELPIEQTKADIPIPQPQDKKKSPVIPREPPPLDLQEVVEKHEQSITTPERGGLN